MASALLRLAHEGYAAGSVAGELVEVTDELGGYVAQGNLEGALQVIRVWAPC